MRILNRLTLQRGGSYERMGEYKADKDLLGQNKPDDAYV